MLHKHESLQKISLETSQGNTLVQLLEVLTCQGVSRRGVDIQTECGALKVVVRGFELTYILAFSLSWQLVSHLYHR